MANHQNKLQVAELLEITAAVGHFKYCVLFHISAHSNLFIHKVIVIFKTDVHNNLHNLIAIIVPQNYFLPSQITSLHIRTTC